MSAKYRVGIIGCGGIARMHAAGYRAEPRCDVVALADIEEETAQEFAEKSGFADAVLYADYREMLREEKPDIVSVCLWPDLHLPVTRDCVEAGVAAVHCEKPMAPTWGECLEFGTLAEESETQITFNHQRRFNHGIRQARELLDGGRFGELQRMDLFAPGHLLDCGTHSLDLGFMFNGDNPAAWVIGQIDARKVRPWFGVPSDFMSIGMFRFQNGVRGTIQVGDEKELGTGVRLFGSGGFLEVFWNGAYGRYAVYEEPDWEPPEVEEPDPMPRVMGDIIDCLESGGEPELSVHKALQVTEVIFAIYESSRRRARIDLPLEITDSPFISMLESGEIGPQD
ncbi:MAG: Gfo/Idh/MocA family oxidoreductase [Candidatus Brocadiaceae bacterium]|jgi:predicted dehydrogenase